MKTIIALALSLMLAACMQFGNKFDPNRVNELQPGVTTMQDAIQKLGPPTAESAMQDGKLLQWQFVYGTVVGGGGAHVAVLFGSDGKMIRVTHMSTTGMESSGAVTQQALTGTGAGPVFGVQGTDVSPQLAANLKLSEPKGFFVAGVVPGSVADKSGVNQGDVILDYNGMRITGMATMAQVFKASPTGQPIPVVVWRGGQEVNLTVKF